jgi:hypothetical protein
MMGFRRRWRSCSTTSAWMIIPCRPSTAWYRSASRSWQPASRVKAVLQQDGPAIGRSGTDDPDADRRLRDEHTFRAAARRRGSSESGLPLVLPAALQSRIIRPSGWACLDTEQLKPFVEVVRSHSIQNSGPKIA